MAEAFEPLAQVRKEFKVNWYRSPIENSRLKQLTKRTDIRGFVQTIGYLLLVAATASVAFYFFTNRMWQSCPMENW